MSDETKFQQAIDALNRARETSGVNMNGKLYSMVKDRVEVFRKTWGSDYGIQTDVDYSNGFSNGSVIVASAQITTKDGIVMASGHAMDRVGSDQVSTTAVVEAVETSAIGRALACFGLHGGEYASDAEMTAIPRKEEAARNEPPRRNDNRPQPPVDLTGLLIPTPDQMRNNMDKVKDKVISDVDMVQSVRELGKYWSELRDFVDVLTSTKDDFLSELKAAFETKNNQLTSKG